MLLNKKEAIIKAVKILIITHKLGWPDRLAGLPGVDVDMYAVVKIKGHQYKVSKGETIEVDRLEAKEGETIDFRKVLLLVDEKKMFLGKPVVEGARVVGKIEKHFKGEKIRVERFKAKSRYRRVKGSRPFLTRVNISKIIAPKAKKKEKKTS